MTPADHYAQETVEVGPFGLFFTNVNTDMGLPGHSHTASLTLLYENVPEGVPTRGFPAFAETYQGLHGRLRELTARAFRNATNEEVARQLALGFADFCPPVMAKWGGRYRLLRVELGVVGVLDAIGHAEGTTTYAVTLADAPLLPPTDAPTEVA